MARADGIDQLPLFAAARQDPNVGWLARLLREAGALPGCSGWMTAAEVVSRSGGRLTDRAVRSLAEAAAPDVISGQKGYKHIEHATAEEVRHFVNWMESQGKKMITRAEAVRRRAHQVFG